MTHYSQMEKTFDKIIVTVLKCLGRQTMSPTSFQLCKRRLYSCGLKSKLTERGWGQGDGILMARNAKRLEIRWWPQAFPMTIPKITGTTQAAMMGLRMVPLHSSLLLEMIRVVVIKLKEREKRSKAGTLSLQGACHAFPFPLRRVSPKL